ncbi:MAG: tRNA 2-thiouridine(34) synthase MnmA [Rhodospirillales bacterium]
MSNPVINLGLGKKPADTRVVVAMSGGVDSSTAAALVKEAGYDTVGMTMQLYDQGAVVPGQKTCCAGRDILDARRVADQLGFPHYVLNYESRFKEQVMDDFADTYLRGETPIPCVRCNQTVKFKDMLGQARELGADALVTGHYVRRVDGDGGAELHRAADPTKDQSYFLFTTTGEQLDFLRFPLGGMDKAETRAHAQRLGLAVADKPESMDICFVPDGNYASIVERLRPEAHDPGEIVNQAGEVLGRHDGIINFTVGQRKGLGIGGMGDPIYVIRLEPDTRRVVVGPKSALGKESLSVHEVNWLGDGPLRSKVHRVEVKIRSMFKPVPATLFGTGDDTAQVKFDGPQDGVAPGQACVFYQGDRVLGGGWIARETGT